MNYLKGSCQKDEFVTVAVSTAAAAVIMAEDPTPGRAWYSMLLPGGGYSGLGGRDQMLHSQGTSLQCFPWCAGRAVGVRCISLQGDAIWIADQLAF